MEYPILFVTVARFNWTRFSSTELSENRIIVLHLVLHLAFYEYRLLPSLLEICMENGVKGSGFLEQISKVGERVESDIIGILILLCK